MSNRVLSLRITAIQIPCNAREYERAIERLWQEFDQMLRIDDVACDLGMSVAGFHHHFKAVTAMSPWGV